MIKPEPYTKEPYPITEAEFREREEREARAKEEQSSPLSLNVCEANFLKLDIFSCIWYNVGVNTRRGYGESAIVWRE